MSVNIHAERARAREELYETYVKEGFDKKMTFTEFIELHEG